MQHHVPDHPVTRMNSTSEAVRSPSDTLVTARGYRWYALGVLVLVFTSSHVDRQITGILLQPIKQDLGASDTAMGFLVGLTFALFYATLGMPIAMLADRSNRRNIIAASVAIWSVMAVLCGMAQNFLQLALARIGVGVGEAGSNPPSHSIISDLFPISERGTAMSIFAMGVNLGLLIAYLGGGWMSQYWGWRATFFVVGVPGLVLALLVRLTLAEPKRGASETVHIDADVFRPLPWLDSSTYRRNARVDGRRCRRDWYVHIGPARRPAFTS